MLEVDAFGVFYTKVINQECEDNITGVMLEESIRVAVLIIPMFGKEDSELIMRNDTHLRQPIYVLGDFESGVFVAFKCVEVVLLHDFIWENQYRNLKIIELFHWNPEIEIYYIHGAILHPQCQYFSVGITLYRDEISGGGVYITIVVDHGAADRPFDTFCFFFLEAAGTNDAEICCLSIFFFGAGV